MSTQPFAPMGNTVTFTANTAAPTAVQAATTGPQATAYEILNAGNVVVFLGSGSNAALANTSAVVASNSQSCIPLLPGTDKVLTFGANAYFTGITSSGTALVYITPGEGL